MGAIKIKEFTKSELLEQLQDVNEISMETFLMGAGFIPVIGEVADAALIVKYFKENRWIEAMLMIIALVPTVGDIAVKPLLFMARKSGALRSAATFEKFLMKNPKAAKYFENIKPHIKSPKVNQYIDDISKKMPGVGKSMKQSQSFLGNVLTKGLGKTVKEKYQKDALLKYIAKKGKTPSNWMSNWWNVVYKGKASRKFAMKKAIIGSNILNSLGLPNFESFEQLISTDAGAQKVMANPEFQQIYSQNTTPEDEQAIEQGATYGEKSGRGNLLSNLGTAGLVGGGIALSIPLLKRIANFVIRN